MKFVFTLTGALFVTITFCQFQLKGVVLASDSKTPLENANVFLSNTSTGTVTNQRGEFIIPVGVGKFDLITSFIGYETNVQTVSNLNIEPIVIHLKVKAAGLHDVVVTSFEKDGWEKWGTFFLENFIGTSEWAANCTIKNYKAIRFRHNKKQNKLTAVTNEQLIIENKALGYIVKYQLEEFEFDFKNKYLVSLGFPYFIQMEGGPAKQRRWNNNRATVFFGSMMHFMRALYINRMAEEGFEIRRLVKAPNLEKRRVREVYRAQTLTSNGGSVINMSIGDSTPYYNRIMNQPDELSTFSPYTITGDSIAYGIDSVIAGLEFENYLHIHYIKAAPPKSYSARSPQNRQMASQVRLADGIGLEVQSSGSFSPPLNLVSYGYWAWSEKMAHMLPLNYKPISPSK